MRQISLRDKVEACAVVTTPQRWGSQPEETQFDYFGLHPHLKDTPVLDEFGKGVCPKKGDKGGGLFPVLCLLDDGRIGCVLRTGMYHEGPGQLSITFSEDKGRTWTDYKVIADPEGYRDKRNPAFGQASNGDLVLVYGTIDNAIEGFRPHLDENGAQIDNFYFMEVIRSSDGGQTWTDPEQLQYDLGPLHFLHPHGQMKRLKNGTLVFNARGDYRRELYDKYPNLPPRISYLFWSYDDGKTWTKQTALPFGHTETGFVELDQYHWLALCRQNGGPCKTAHSYDGGHLWQDLQACLPGADDPEPREQFCRHPGQPILLPNGKIVLVYGYRKYPFGLGAIVSHDGGVTFDSDTEYIITDSFFSEDCGYPSTVVFPDGTVVTATYTLLDFAHPEWKTCCIAYVYDERVFE